MYTYKVASKFRIIKKVQQIRGPKMLLHDESSSVPSSNNRAPLYCPTAYYYLSFLGTH